MRSEVGDEVYSKTILMFGPPGAGKGTWGRILGMMPGFYHLSTGEMFRKLDPDSQLGQKARDFMKRGELVPDNITVELWRQHLNRTEAQGVFNPHHDVLVLDGFPRTIPQAEQLKEVIDLKAILRLESPDREILIERLRHRAILENRTDDARESTIQHRFEFYDNETQPVLTCFPEELIVTIDVDRPPLEILAAMSTSLLKYLSG